MLNGKNSDREIGRFISHPSEQHRLLCIANTQQMNIDSIRFFTDADEHWTDHSPSTINTIRKCVTHNDGHKSRKKKNGQKKIFCDTLECLAGFNEYTNTF